MENFPEVNQPEPRLAPSAPETPPESPKEKAIHIKLKISKRTIIIVVAVVLACGLVYAVRGLFIAAMVDGHVISRFSVIRELEKSGGKNVLDSLITQKLIDAEARKKGVSVSADELAAEIKNIDDRLTGQGTTLVKALADENMTLEDLKKQIGSRKTLEKLLAESLTVTDDEVGQYIKDNKITIPKGQEEEFKTQIANQLKEQKFGENAQALADALKSAAKIWYFVGYGK